MGRMRKLGTQGVKLSIDMPFEDSALIVASIFSLSVRYRVPSDSREQRDMRRLDAQDPRPEGTKRLFDVLGRWPLPAVSQRPGYEIRKRYGVPNIGPIHVRKHFRRFQELGNWSEKCIVRICLSKVPDHILG